MGLRCIAKKHQPWTTASGTCLRSAGEHGRHAEGVIPARARRRAKAAYERHGQQAQARSHLGRGHSALRGGGYEWNGRVGGLAIPRRAAPGSPWPTRRAEPPLGPRRCASARAAARSPEDGAVLLCRSPWVARADTRRGIGRPARFTITWIRPLGRMCSSAVGISPSL